jgi:hypothetical protein
MTTMPARRKRRPTLKHEANGKEIVDTHRLHPVDHLELAAQCNLGSDAERYHLAAATAEALAAIADSLDDPRRTS